MCTKGKCYYGLVPSLIVTCFSPVVLAQEPPGNAQPLLNVVLVELNTAPDPKLKESVVNDWPYWTGSAGKLIESLESVLGYVRAGGGVENTNASLFAVRGTAKGLDDTAGLTPLANRLDHISQVAGRVSFLVVWIPEEQSVILSLHDHEELKATTALAMAGFLHSAQRMSRHSSSVGNAYLVPPCDLICMGTGVSGAQKAIKSLDTLLDAGMARERLMHCIRASEVQFAKSAISLILSGAKPAGAGISAENITTLQSYKNYVLESATHDTLLQTTFMATLADIGIMGNNVLSQPWHFDIGSWGSLSTAGGGAGINTNLGTTFTPGGILLEPRLMVVMDKVGLTGALASEAVAAVQDKPAGEFQHDGKTYWAARAPGTAGLIRIPGGAFRFHHVDVLVEREGHDIIRLERFYDSSASSSSPLGPGWSIEPFALEISQRLPVKGVKTEVALKPVLVDRRASVRLPYRLDTAPATEPKPPDPLAAASYRRLSSSLQPDLTTRADGGYLASFAHGFQITFDRAGQIEWMGRDEGDRTTYVRAGQLLKEIRGAGGSIALSYDDRGYLTGARASSGRGVYYILDDSGRLNSVSGFQSADLAFTYGSDNRLATLAAGNKNLAANTYDDKGRMLTHRTPQGRWRFAYDDRIGHMTVSGPDGKVTDYYYDAQRRLAAYGAAKDRMTLFNYDVSGRILQVAMAELINDPSRGELPRFKVSEMVTPLPAEGVSTTKEP